MEGVLEAEDKHHEPSGSRVLPNEEEEAGSQGSSAKTQESQESLEPEKTDETKDNDEITQLEDFKMMVDNYKQIGGELKYNLKILENKYLSLQNSLLQETHECEILSKQKEYQMKNLVELQIRLENLDMERVKLLKESQQDKAEKIEAFTRDMQSILENNEFIWATYNKINEIVNTEKQDFNELLKKTKNLKEFHKKAGENYIKEVTALKSSFFSTFSPLIEEDKHLKEEIKNKLGECNVLRENVMKVKRKVFMAKEELNKINKINQQLQSNLEQRKNALKEKENAFQQKETQFRENCLERENEIKRIKEKTEKLIFEHNEKLEIISMEEERQNSLKLSCDEIKLEIPKLQLNVDSKKQELCALNEEYESIFVQLNNAKIEEAKLQELASKLPSVSGTLNDLRANESEIKEAIALLKAEIAANEEIYKNLQEDENSLREKEKELLISAEEWELKLVKIKKELEDLYGLSREHCVTAGKQLAEKYKELDQIMSEVNEQQLEENILDNALMEAEKEIDELKGAINILCPEGNFDEEVNELNLLSEELNNLNTEYERAQEKEKNLEKELSLLKKDLESLPQVIDLENELQEILSEINEETLHHKEQMAAAEKSHLSQQANWENKVSKEINELERRSSMIDIRIKKKSAAVPIMNNELTELEKELKGSLPPLMKELKVIYEIYEKMASYFKNFTEMEKEKEIPPIVKKRLELVEEHLSEPMKYMMSFEGIPKIDLDKPTSDGYAVLLKAFREKYLKEVNDLNSDLPLEMSLKVCEISTCVLGKKWEEPSYPETLNDTGFSSTAEAFNK